MHYLGSNMPANDLGWLLQDRSFELIAIAATLTLHLGALAATIARIRANTNVHGAGGKRPAILVGGELFGIVPDLHAAVGADAGAADAVAAVAAARRLSGR